MVLNRNQGETERLMREGQAAAKRGDKAMSRMLLTQLLELEPNNEQAWMWLSGAVIDPNEQQTCLENVLIINPNNEQARKGLGYIQAKTGKAASAAFERFSGPLSMDDLPPEAREISDSMVAPLQPDIVSNPESQPHLTPLGLSQEDIPDFVKGSFSQSPSGDSFTPIEGVIPFHVPDDVTQSAATNGESTAGTAPDKGKTLPEWVQNLSGHGTAKMGDLPNDHQMVELPQATVGTGNGNGVATQQLPNGTDHDADLNAWLNDLAASAQPGVSEHPQNGSSTAHLPVPATEQLAPQGPFPADPFTGPDMMSFAPAGPFTSMQLPQPGDLPGSHSSDSSQPWYLQGSNDPVPGPPEDAPSAPYPVDGAATASPSHKEASGPIATIECPNCYHNVPETSLACPECRYTFFVHCPHCHELVDTSMAVVGVIEPCPYCSVDINKMELGRINLTGVLEVRESEPKEDEKSWVGEGLTRPNNRRGLLLTFSWLIDLVWLMLIVLMVWALTQLPSWWHLTNLYN